MLRRFSLPTIAGLFFALPALAQVQPDRVYYRDRAQDNKVVTVDGEAKETASGVQVFGPAPGKAIKATISATDMVRIEYGSVPGVERTSQQAAMNMETAAVIDAGKIRDAFGELAKFPGATTNPKAKRYLDFRVLFWTSKIADTKTKEDFVKEGRAVADKLATFSKANDKSWECWMTARMAARYYCELDEPSLAADVIGGSLSRNAALSPELRHEAKLLEAGYLFRANKRLDVEAILKELAGDKDFAATGPLRERYLIFEEIVKAPLPPPAPKPGDPPPSPEELDARAVKVKEATAKAEAIIVKAKDLGARGAGYSALGEVYIRHGMTRDAMWAFLWVDVVYNQDRDEQIKAVHRLIQLFEALKEKESEKDRAEIYRDRLPKLR